MRKYLAYFLILLTVSAFISIFMTGSTLRRKYIAENKIIHHVSEIAARDYLKDSIISTIIFAPKPIFYDETECVLVGFVNWKNSSGLKYKSRIEVFLKMKNHTWTAFMVTIDDPQPFVNETKTTTHYFWDLLLKRNN